VCRSESHSVSQVPLQEEHLADVDIGKLVVALHERVTRIDKHRLLFFKRRRASRFFVFGLVTEVSGIIAANLGHLNQLRLL
jgi:hypothetical protein